MNLDLRWIIILMANCLLILMAGEMNHHLSVLSLHAFIGGLLVTFAALRLQIKPAFLASGLTALLLDALTPLPEGTLFLMLMGAHTLIFAARGNFSRESTLTGTAIAMGANTAIMLGISVSVIPENVAPGPFWQRAFVDILFSQGIVAVVAPWFFSLQMASLQLVGINLDAEQREAQ